MLLKIPNVLTPEELAQYSPDLDEEYFEVLKQGSWLESKLSEGGTSSTSLKIQLGQADGHLAFLAG